MTPWMLASVPIVFILAGSNLPTAPSSSCAISPLAIPASPSIPASPFSPVTVTKRSPDANPQIDDSHSPSSSAPDGVGTVSVSSDPDGAEIFIDDKFLGNAPATLKLSPGSHAVLLKFPGHADWRRTLEVLKSSKVSLKATLEPIS